jgi:5-methylcytosine-specific restriction protein A
MVVRAKLPDHIPRRFLIAAMDDLDAGTTHAFGPSTRYDVVFRARRYPPKAVVALAAVRLDGRILKPGDFWGGLGTACFRILTEAGLQIVAKGDIDPHGADVGGELEEGERLRVEVNRYERDARARERCLAHHGRRCAVCDLDFGERYGTIGEGFIHVHHVRPLSTSAGSISVDPVRDLQPVCPNCHAMLHRRLAPYTIVELRELLVANGPRATVVR